MNTETLLIELGTEELPPKSLKALSSAFNLAIIDGLKEAELISAEQASTAQFFATPRRLAISVPSVIAAQPDQVIEKRGPAVQAAFNDAGEATPAAQGFAKSCGVEVSDLQRLKTDKGEWLSYETNETGKSINELIPNIIGQAIKRLPIAKRMRWGAGEAEFVRPVHWLIVMHGDSLIDTSILDINSSNKSRGHRFHGQAELTITHADDYEKILAHDGCVIASFAQRQELIKQQTATLTQQVAGSIEEDAALLDEVTSLVEQPTAVLGSFSKDFLEVPQECLISSMRDHQKYFHIIDKNGKLLPNFITISNIDSKNPERVISGNERVLRARLSDAQFFWQTDLKSTLESRISKLGDVLFHVKLGSILDKTKRIELLAKNISEQISADSDVAQRAAKLAKADLVTNMVGEFDSLQGLMGRYYANNDNETPLVGDCIEQHYWPKFAGDQLPQSGEAQALALADRLDSLVGIFASGEIPTGDKDPYGLRRAALGVLRILIEQKHNLKISALVRNSAEVYATSQNINIDNETQQQLVNFIRGRLISYYQSQNIQTTTINAVMACEPDQPLDFDYRINAVNQFRQADEAANLAAANKRISNILKKQSLSEDIQVDQSLLVEQAEKELYTAISNIQTDCLSLFDDGDYSDGLQKLASLRTPVDQFFEDVMVMCDDVALQKNRLALLRNMQQLFLRVADIALLQN